MDEDERWEFSLEVDHKSGNCYELCIFLDFDFVYEYTTKEGIEKRLKQLEAAIEKTREVLCQPV